MTQKQGLFSRLTKSRQALGEGLKSIFSSSREISDDMYYDLEDQLLIADLGVDTCSKVIESLKQKDRKNRYRTSDDLLEGLREALLELLKSGDGDDAGDMAAVEGPHVTLMVGVNGVGKTTTLAKLANHYKAAGNSVMLAACDTYRAAAIEQLRTWGERLDIPVVAQVHGADAAAVAFDAYSAACARGIDHLLVDTAGRQHTHTDLMEQLTKIRRVLAKADPAIPQEILITVDAGNGQNVISQVSSFGELLPLTGLCVTKLDGTAKGGVVFALVSRFGLPIRYIGTGEGIDDFQPFDPEAFVEALLPSLPESEQAADD